MTSMSVESCPGLVINAPEWFTDPAFQNWLRGNRRLFTWYDGGVIDEWSDVVVLVDPGLNGEGSDSDMPAHIWNRIVAACRTSCRSPKQAGHHIMVRLTNLDA
jgi:hypothetical protein